MDSAWKAFSTLDETCVFVNFHCLADPRIPITGIGGIPSDPTVSHTAMALILMGVWPSWCVSRVHPLCQEVYFSMTENCLSCRVAGRAYLFQPISILVLALVFPLNLFHARRSIIGGQRLVRVVQEFFLSSIHICHIFIVLKYGVKPRQAASRQETYGGDEIRYGPGCEGAPREPSQDDVVPINVIRADEIVGFSYVL